ncbi:MAG: DUF2207 domain-containing protein [Candidatus Wenzhouxiangella sp. M2_3B_020]
MKLDDRDLRICLFAYALTAVSLAFGHDDGPEFIESLDTGVQLRESGVLDVTHVIDVHPHGDEIRRGLFFELPGDIGPLGGFSVTLNGKAIDPEFDDGAIVAASERPLNRHQRHRFVIRYRADAPLWGTGRNEARLRWRPVIEQFELPWRSASLSIRWPASVEALELPSVGTAGEPSWQLAMRGPADDKARSEPVGDLEFLWNTTALPAAAVRHYGEDWGWRTGLALAILVLLGFLHTAWRAVGRDPDPGRVEPRAEPPDGISPAAARYLRRMGFDETAFVAALVSMRVKGAIDIELGEGAETLRLLRRASGSSALSPGERALSEALFADDDRIELGPGDSRGATAAKALKNRLGREHRGRHFRTHDRQRVGGIVLGLGVAALGIAGLVVQLGDAMSPDPVAIGLGVAAILIGVVAPLVYFELFKSPTRAGAEVRRQIAGLEKHLGGTGPLGTDARTFVELLPYAVALEAEEAWRKRFDLGDQPDVDDDVADVLRWYREIRAKHDSAAAIVPIIAATSGATAATSAGASGGASAGGV